MPTIPLWETTLRGKVDTLILQAKADKKMLILTNQNVIQSVAPPVSKPYAPGHYVFPLQNAQQPNNGVSPGPTFIDPLTLTVANINGVGCNSDMNSFLVDGVKGFLIRYPWRALELSLGDYSAVQNCLDVYLAWAATKTLPDGSNPTIQLMIEDRSYDVADLMLPSYMDALTYTNSVGTTTANYEQKIASGNGWCSMRHLAYVVNRYNKLIDFIAARYDTNPLFFGIATQETAMGISATTENLFDYTHTKLRQSYTSKISWSDNSGTADYGILYNLCNKFVYSKVSWFFNFFPGKNSECQDVAADFAAFPNWITRRNIYAGGPDCLPESFSLNHQFTGTGESAFPQYLAIHNLNIKTFIDMSPPCYDEVHSTLSGTSAAAVPSITNITKAASAVVTVNTVSVSNPYSVGDYIFFAGVGGMTQINSATGAGGKVTAISGSSGAWKATVNINSSGYSAYTSGGTGARYWTIQEHYNFTKNTLNPVYPPGATLYASFMYWYPVGSGIYDWSPDATTFIAANPLINP